ncbi:hypothetical protein EW026_g7286 [Hermanssonia centrifuga]|uniref:Uncharacterized protein n=1 Tax=Hermanssonia centrifuga TaxID=98765 RepID=A0A4S4K8B2_9APHY|nr:hypothetical protein EW026_g7286 [Hermanssonia centrifuga]
MYSQDDIAQPRDRRAWTEEEDELLRAAIDQEDADASPPSKWHAIAKHIPHRTNKDCRKRWWAQMATRVSKGSWSTEEDERLFSAVDELGTKWAAVAGRVGTRNSGRSATSKGRGGARSLVGKHCSDLSAWPNRTRSKEQIQPPYPGHLGSLIVHERSSDVRCFSYASQDYARFLNLFIILPIISALHGNTASITQQRIESRQQHGHSPNPRRSYSTFAYRHQAPMEYNGGRWTAPRRRSGIGSFGFDFSFITIILPSRITKR